MTATPPYRIVTERLVVRCWEPRDAPLVKDAVDRFRGQFDLLFRDRLDETPSAAVAVEAYDAAGSRVL